MASQFGQQLFRVVTLIILARFFIDPKEFGLVNMFVVITSFSQVLIDSGFTQSLVQKEKLSQDDTTTVFYFNLVVCALVTLVLLAATPFIAAFYRRPELEPIGYALCPIYLLYGLSSLQRLHLQRDMRFKELAWVELVSIVIGSLVSIALCMLGANVWGLVAFYLVNTLVATIMFWIGKGAWRPNGKFSIQSLKEALPFSGPLLGNSSLNYWARNLDKVIVGRSLGDVSLGLYNQAYALVLMPVNNISNSMIRVLFPSFSRLQNDREEIASNFAKVSRGVLFVNLPLFGLLAICAREFVQLFLGPKWIEIVFLLRVFAFTGLFISLRTIHSSIFQALNKTGQQLKFNLLTRAISILGFFYFVTFGIEGLAFWVLGTTILSWFCLSIYSCRLLHASAWRFLLMHGQVFVLGGFSTMTTLLARWWLGPEGSGVLLLTLSVSVFAACYLGAAAFLGDTSFGLFFRQARRLASRFGVSNS